MALRTVGAKLTLDNTDYIGKLRQSAVATKDFVGQLDKANKAGHLDAVADRAAVAGVALVGAAGAAIKMRMDFDKAMSGVKAATHAGADEIDLLRKAAIEAGKSSQYSATEAADAITELSKAGVSTADVLGGGLKGALDLAAAGQLNVGEAAETAASALTQFRLRGKDVPHVADLLAAAAGKAQGSVHDVGMALNQSGLVAAQFGLSIEDTTGALAEFANAGLIGSDAGTSFKTMLLAIANPSGTTAKQMQALGISFYDAQGRFIGLSGVAEMLRKRLGDLTEQQRQQALGQIFGSDAIRAATVLYKDGAEGVTKWKNAVNESGYASKTAAALTDNLAGDVERLKGAVETLAIEAGGGANGGLRVLVKTLGALVDEIGSLPPVVTSSLTVLAGVGGVAALAAAGWLKARRASAAFRTELEAMGPAGEKAAAGMSKFTSAATKAAGVFALLETAGAVIGHFQKDLNPQLDAMAVGLEKFADGGKLAGEASRVLGDNLEDLKVGFAFLADSDNNRRAAVKNLQQGLEAIIPGLDGTNTSLKRTQERISAMDAALAQLASSGNGAEANQIFNKLAEQLAVGGVSMEEFRKQFPQYAAALESTTKQTDKAAGATGDLNSAFEVGAGTQDEYKTKTASVAGVIRGETEAIISLSKQLRAQIDPAFALIDAQQGLAKAQDAASKALKEHGRGSKEAKAADRELTLAALDLEEKAGRAAATFDGKLDPALRATLKAGGLTEGQIRDVAKQLRDAKRDADKYTGKYEALVSAPGAKGAKKDIDLAYTAANHFAGPYAANLRVTGQGKVEAELTKLSRMQQALKTANTLDRLGGKGYAVGGPVRGPGSGTSDSVPAMLSNGEHVWTAKEVQAAGGHAAVSSLRSQVVEGGPVPGFAAGGPVLWPFPVNASKTKVPEAPAAPQGGRTSDWIVAVVRQAFPGLRVLSKDRPGAITLTGNRSYHSMGRAVDFEYSKPLAEWINLHYMRATRELITPWQSLNIQNGRRHSYSPIVYNQHNFSGGNPHDHWAMKHGGTINEPIFGVGASGRTYSFGENYQSERVIPNWQGGSASGGVTVAVSFNGPVGSQYELEGWLSASIDNLRRRGKI